MNAAAADMLVNLGAHPLLWPLSRALRRAGRVVRVPGLGLVINDAALAHEVLVRDVDFTKNGERSIAALMTAAIGPSALANMDGEAHRVLRSRLTDLFAPEGARRLLAGSAPQLASLSVRLRAGETVDLARFMRILSGRITFDMLGLALPAGHEDSACLSLLALGERISAALTLGPSSRGTVRALLQDCSTLAEHVRAGFVQRDLPDASLMARLRELGFTFDEARGVLSLVFLAGTITTAAALPRIVALLVDSGQWDALRASDDGIARALSEGLRYTAPVPATVRIAVRDATLLGHRVRAGSRLVILTSNLARDAALFPHPDRFDASRVHDPRARHLWYGAGPHFCLGFAVAQLQLRLVLETLLDAPGTLTIARRRVARRRLVAAYAQLDVRFADVRP